MTANTKEGLGSEVREELTTDILILDILAQLNAIYMVVGKNFSLHYANPMLSAHAL